MFGNAQTRDGDAAARVVKPSVQLLRWDEHWIQTLVQNLGPFSRPFHRNPPKLAAILAEFESDLIRMRTREGMAVARAKGKLRGKQPKLSDRQSRELRRMYDTGDYSVSDLAEVFSVSRPTVYRTLQRQPAAT